MLAVNEQAIELALKINDYRTKYNNKLRQRSRTVKITSQASNPADLATPAATTPATDPVVPAIEQKSSCPVPTKHVKVVNPAKKEAIKMLADWDFEMCVAWLWHRFIRNPSPKFNQILPSSIR